MLRKETHSKSGRGRALRAFLSAFLCVLLLLCIADNLRAQQAWQSALERYAEGGDSPQDFSYLIDDLADLQAAPLNLNTDEAERLLALHLIDELQYAALRAYIKDNGALLSFNELLYVEGFDESACVLLPYFCTLGSVAHFDSLRLRPIKQALLLRYKRVFQADDNYWRQADLPLSAPVKQYYVGSPDKFYMRYKLDYKRKWTAGLLAEKDPGEAFLSKAPEALDTMIRRPYARGFDFYSAFVGLQTESWVKKAVVGDYHLLLGQGLNMWTAPAFGKGSAVEVSQRYGHGLKGNSSANETAFLRGAAVEMGVGKLSALLFCAAAPHDAALHAADSGKFVESIAEDGYHRSPSEINRKHALDISLCGANIAWQHLGWRLSVIHSYTAFSAELRPKAYERLQRFRGRSTHVSGASYTALLAKVYLFGECSYQHEQQALAFLQGMSGALGRRLRYTVLFRHYPSSYHNRWSAAFGEQSHNSNETGLYFGFAMPLLARLHIKGYVDMFRFPWMRWQVAAPTLGSESGLRADYDMQSGLSMYAHWRYQKHAQQQMGQQALPAVVYNSKWSLRYKVSYRLSPRWALSNQIDYQWIRYEDGALASAMFVAQDLRYTSSDDRLMCQGRIAFFNTDGYAARVYVYEHDLLYAFSVPAFYSRGLRVYALCRYKHSRQLSLWCKLATTWHHRRADAVEATSAKDKVEVSLQLQWKPNVYRNRKKLADQ